MSLTMIYITAGSKEEAMKIGHAMVESRLAACANVLPGITSMYWWEGALQEDSEMVLILKTRRDLAGRVIARVKELHSYDCPCVVSLPITGGNAEYLDWIVGETH